MSIRIAKILVFLALFCSISCQKPPKVDLRAFFPQNVLMYMETSDLSSIGKVFTANKDWKTLSRSDAAYLPYLKGKQAALAVTALRNEEREGALQIKPNLVLAVDSELSESETFAISEKIVRELAAIFLKEEGDLQKSAENGQTRIKFTVASGKQLFAATSGSVVLVANSEEALTECLAVKQGGGENLGGSQEFLQIAEQNAADDRIAFGYVSEKGVSEVSNYLGVTYAVESSDNSFMREIILGTLPGFLQNTVRSITWSARAAENGIEDEYLFKTKKQFADNAFQTIKPTAAQPDGLEQFIPKDTHSISDYRLENPQLAWRGMVLSLAAEMAPKSLGIFQQFSGQLLKPYGIDDPELFLSAVDQHLVTVRFDPEGSEAAVVVKVKDKEKLSQSISETFESAQSVETVEGTKLIKNSTEEFYAATVGDILILGNARAVDRCLKAYSNKENENATTPARFANGGAIVNSRQKDDSAVQILTYVARENAQAVKVDSYAFSEVRIEGDGIRRRTISAFGLLGEMFKQTFE